MGQISNRLRDGHKPRILWIQKYLKLGMAQKRSGMAIESLAALLNTVECRELANPARCRKLWLSLEIGADADEEDSQSVLRDAKGRSVHYARCDAIGSTETKIFEDLLTNGPAADVLKTRNILHHEDAGPHLPDHCDVMPIQPVPLVVYETVMVPDLRERLAGRTADNGVYLKSADVTE